MRTVFTRALMKRHARSAMRLDAPTRALPTHPRALTHIGLPQFYFDSFRITIFEIKSYIKAPMVYCCHDYICLFETVFGSNMHNLIYN